MPKIKTNKLTAEYAFEKAVSREKQNSKILLFSLLMSTILVMVVITLVSSFSISNKHAIANSFYNGTK
jgi:hypothetical protein